MQAHRLTNKAVNALLHVVGRMHEEKRALATLEDYLLAFQRVAPCIASTLIDELGLATLLRAPPPEVVTLLRLPDIGRTTYEGIVHHAVTLAKNDRETLANTGYLFVTLIGNGTSPLAKMLARNDITPVHDLQARIHELRTLGLEAYNPTEAQRLIDETEKSNRHTQGRNHRVVVLSKSAIGDYLFASGLEHTLPCIAEPYGFHEINGVVRRYKNEPPHLFLILHAHELHKKAKIGLTKDKQTWWFLWERLHRVFPKTPIIWVTYGTIHDEHDRVYAEIDALLDVTRFQIDDHLTDPFTDLTHCIIATLAATEFSSDSTP